MVEMSFGVAEMFAWITLGMAIGCGFFFPLAVAGVIKKAFRESAE